MTLAPDLAGASDAVRTDLGAIFVSLELSRATWLMTSLSPGGGEKMSRHPVRGGDVAGLLGRLADLQARARARTGPLFALVVIQEAGLDGFWLHRVLEREGLESHVVEAASVAPSRRRRRAKTDRIDGEALVRRLLADTRGEPRVCAMVRGPTPEEEDRRRLCRELKTLIRERVRHANRIRGVLFTPGVGDDDPRRAPTGGPGLRCCERGMAGPCRSTGRRGSRASSLVWSGSNTPIDPVRAERDARVTAEAEAHVDGPAMSMLLGRKGIGPGFAGGLWSEGLFRPFDNRRQLAAYAGLAPTPWQSGTINHEQGVSKAGHPRLCAILVEMAWLGLRPQPGSALARWTHERVQRSGGRMRKVAIVALARKLLVALWRSVTAGVVIEGAATASA